MKAKRDGLRVPSPDAAPMAAAMQKALTKAKAPYATVAESQYGADAYTVAARSRSKTSLSSKMRATDCTFVITTKRSTKKCSDSALYATEAASASTCRKSAP